MHQGVHDPTRITWTNVWLERVIQVAYDFPGDRISGPDWLGSARCTIVASLPMGTRVADFRLMLQKLLAERFKLATHRGTKDVSGYGLEVAKNGLKIAGEIQPIAANRDDAKVPSAISALVMVDPSGFPAPRPGNAVYAPGSGFEATIAVSGRNRATVLNHSMPAVAQFLGNLVAAPVEDRTGSKGTYSFHLEYAPGPSGATGDSAAGAASDPGADVFAAVQEQLGLRLVAKKVPVETLVIDHLEKIPTGN
jgi:uncharacterized protein (TIGR03435 family)